MRYQAPCAAIHPADGPILVNRPQIHLQPKEMKKGATSYYRESDRTCQLVALENPETLIRTPRREGRGRLRDVIISR